MTDGVITPYSIEEFKMCALDLVNSAANLAYIDPKKAKELEFHTEYFIMNSREIQENFDEHEDIHKTSTMRIERQESFVEHVSQVSLPRGIKDIS